MSTFMGLDHKCISSLATATSPSFRFSWGEIAFLILPSLASYELASSTNIFVCFLLFPIPQFRHKPTSQVVRTVYHHEIMYQPDLRLILIRRHKLPYDNQQSSSYSATNGPLMNNNHKQPISHPWILSLPSTSSVSTPTQALCRPH